MRFVQGLGAEPSVLTADAHDRLMAFVSHLPQVTASVLLHTVGTAVGEAGLALSGPGLADTTRLAASPPGIWTDILASNADHVRDAIDALVRELERLRTGLREPDRIPQLFESAGTWRRALKRLGEAKGPPARRLTDNSSTREIPATRTYLEMLERPASTRPLPAGYRLARVAACPPSFFRFLYREVGRAWNWLDRLSWSDEEIDAYLTQPGLELWVLTQDSLPFGYAELHRSDGGEVQIVYFGLMPHAIGKGIGAAFLADTLQRAWNSETRRVWLHTCTLDHEHALATYVKGGFRIVREEAYTARIAVPAPTA